MGTLELRSKEIIELVSQCILGEVSCVIDYEFHFFTFKIYSGEPGWNWRGDIHYVMDMTPYECARKICTAYRDWVLDTHFQKRNLEYLLHSRN